MIAVASNLLAAESSARSFEEQMRAALPGATKPSLGASVSIQQVAATSTATNREPYDAGHDRASGIVAAGGALLAALLIVLLLVLVASSRHHDHA